MDFWGQVGTENPAKTGQDRPRKGRKGKRNLLAKTLPNLLKKPWFWGGEALGAEGEGRNPGPPKALKSKKITKTLKLKLLVNSRKHD